MYNTITHNLSYNNGLHGIMLHEKSNNNIVENNIIEGNTSGVAVWHSSNNIVRNNVLDKNRHGIRMNEGSDNNLAENNTISNSIFYAFYLYDDANQNNIRNNTLSYNHVGLYVKTKNNTISDNRLYNNNVGIYFLATASKNIAHNNTITQSAVYGFYTKINDGLSNALGNNVLAENRKDISGEDLGE